jgi:hypothetical protein
VAALSTFGTLLIFRVAGTPTSNNQLVFAPRKLQDRVVLEQNSF